MRDEILLPSAPGAYAEWPTLVGAPTPWEAVRDLDGKYIASATAGQRHSFPVTLPVPAIANDETLVSAVYRASLAAPLDLTDHLRDGGFEKMTTYWSLATECAIQGASFAASPVRSGTRNLRLYSRTIGPICGQANQTVSGLIPGQTYKLAGYYRTTNVATQQFKILIDGVEVGDFGSSSAVFLPFTATFLATATSHTITVYFRNLDSAPRVYFLDDLTLTIVPSDAVVTPFYRLYGNDTDLASWSLPSGSGFTMQPDRAISLYGHQLRDGALELGVRNENGPEVRLDQAKLDVSLRFARDSMGFVGGGGVFR